MKCPNCGDDLRYPENAYQYMNTQRVACTVSTLCCGIAVRLVPRMKVEAYACNGIDKDDWGNPCEVVN